MANFAIWATACETAFWSTGTFMRCYETNRRASIDDVVDADPVAACVQGIMATRSAWTGNATDLLRAGADLTDDGIWRRNARLAQKSARARRPPSPGSNLPAGGGHRHCFQS